MMHGKIFTYRVGGSSFSRLMKARKGEADGISRVA